MRLRLIRDATANELKPLPPTNVEWSAFISSFKDAVQRRDFRILSITTARSFRDADSALLSRPPTPAEEIAHVKWDEVNSALTQGVESSSSTPWGAARRLIVEEHPSLNRSYRVRLTFTQNSDNQWRWSGIDYPRE
jgi:hypothetical protein